MWPQVDEAKNENRRELLIVGNDLNKQLSLNDGILDPSIFKLIQLNFLRLAKSTLTVLPEELGHLENLSSLELQNNNITLLPKSIGNLKKLKLLDISENNLQSLPHELNYLPSLTSVYLRNNKLIELIGFEESSSLSIIDIQMNKLTSFKHICNEMHPTLSEILASGNQIDDIPEEIKSLTSLKNLNLSQNCIKEIPADILHCTKLKEINLKGNPLSDKRFKKLVESDRGFSKTVLDYMKQHLNSADGSGKKKKKGKSSESEVDMLAERLSVMPVLDDLVIKVSSEVKNVRQFIVCCTLQNLDLSGSKLKTFLSIQTKLHDGICEKRVAATIATHDRKKLKGPLFYCVKSPKGISILPLGGNTKVSAFAYFKNLKGEAEAIRKEQKKNVTSGLYKYISLVECMELWPCLLDSEENVISLPPLTNAENTKIDNDTTDVFIEVTGHSSFSKCKTVMETLILETLNSCLTTEKTENEKKYLKIEQGRVVDEDGKLKLVFPSRTDLVYSNKNISIDRSNIN